MIIQPPGEAPSLSGHPARRTPDVVPDGRISGAPARAAKGRHLRAALAAVVLVALALAGGASYADRTETRYIHALAPDLSQQKGLGSALPIAAFRQPDLLPVYGSSELDHYLGPYHASELFRTYPSGFTIFPIRKDGTAALTLLQDLAGVGPDLRGKKLVISLSLTWFIFGDAASPEYYAGNFSRLHAGQLAFSTDLSLDLKHDAATRMLQFPATLEQDPLLKLGLETLADGSVWSRGLYYLLLPLGKLQNLVLRLQDHWETLTYIRQRPDLSPEVPRQARPLDWPSLLAGAEREARQAADSNRFGFENPYWQAYGDKLTQQKSQHSDPTFLRAVRQAVGWADFDLMLRALRELGARPLILSAPIKGLYYDYWGVSGPARRAYYQRVRELVAARDLQSVDFAEFDLDPYFVGDYRSHLSAKGWAHFAQAMDAFQHGTPH